MSRKIFCLICLLTVITTLEASAQKKRAFKYLDFPDSTRSVLKIFLALKEGTDTSECAALVFDILGNEQSHHYQLTDGLFTLKTIEAHCKPYLFANENGHLNFVEDYKIEPTLHFLLKYFEQHPDLPVEDKLKYVQAFKNVAATHR